MRISLIMWILILSVAAFAQPATFEDPLLDRFVGQWLLEGTIAGGEVTHDIDAAWVLGHRYLRFHELARERDEFGLPAYEASVTIGRDEPSGRYVCQWLDSTGGGGLINDAYGYAEPAADTLAFVFGMGEDTTWHTTFAYDRDADIWHWTMDGKSGDQVRPFARNTMTRRTEPRPTTPQPILPEALVWAGPADNPQLKAAWVLGTEHELGPYVLRVSLAQGGRILVHSHPDTRHSTVLSGTLYVGFGDEFDESTLVAIPAGGAYVAPANVPHFLQARDGDVVYQESGVGPTATVSGGR